MYKKIGILAVVAVSSFWFWVVIKAWLASDIKFALVSVWAWPLAIFVITSAIVAVAYLLLPNFYVAWLGSWIIALMMLAVLGLTRLNAVAALIIIALSAYSVTLERIEARDRTKLHTFLIFRRGLSWVVLPLLIAISFAYYQSPEILKRAQEGMISPTVEDVVSVTTQAFLKSQGENLTPAQQAEVQKQITHRTLEEFSILGERYAAYLPPVLAFGFFLVLWGLAFIFIYLSVFLSMLIFWILRKIDFIKIEIQQVPSEFIKL